MSVSSQSAAGLPGDALARCYHCHSPIHGEVGTFAEIDGVQRPMCCKGCKSAAEAIVAGGLDDYYRRRSRMPGAPAQPSEEFARETRVYDLEDAQRTFVRRLDSGEREASLILGGIQCAACASLNERHLQKTPGVVDAQVNFSTHRATVRWNPEHISLSDILSAVKRIGYTAHPYDPDRQEALLERERRQQLRRLGVAGGLGMQVMMIAVALYAGEWYGIGEEFRRLFMWLSLALTVPVLLYCARPFFSGALRDLRNLGLGMDVPVSLGLAIAFLGSVHATFAGVGAVYYDSVVMFVFFLLLARYLELMARRKSAQLSEALVNPAPVMATRLDACGAHTIVAVAELEVGDRVLVRPGEPIPADGRVLEGRASVDEALLTGESRPVAKSVDDAVIGGSINLDSPLQIRVERTGPDTVLSRILDLVERARNERPRIQRAADRAAAWFVAAVLMLALATAAYWLHTQPERWLPITVAMLVVTCPCALSLATPTAIAAATGALTRRALILTGSNALETLARADRFVFDKTGTLTHGRPRVVKALAISDMAPDVCARIAASLERHSEHAIAKALVANARAETSATEVVNTPGGGLQGNVSGTLYTIGTPSFVEARTGHALTDRLAEEDTDDACSLVVLADASAARCLFYLRDELRPDASELVASLRRYGNAVSLYSGDRTDITSRIAAEIGIDDVAAGLSPQEKLARVRELQNRGEVVAMVGDGINDTPVLSGADVSIAMGDGAQAARASADMILIGNDLSNLAEGTAIARRTLSVIRQNLLWAATYNLLAIPAAAAGFVAPWMAAIGMSASSLLVVANSMRLARSRRRTGDDR